MTLDPEALRRLGILPAFRDAFGRDREIDPAVLHTIAEIMGGLPDAAADPVRVARRGAALPPGAELVLEDGTALGSLEAVPLDAPHGYHHLETDAGRQLLIVGPRRCHLPAALRASGWAVQLYAARSGASWGIGDLADLRALGAWSRRESAALLLVSPLDAASPTQPQQPSPYYPSTRRFRNPLYLRIEEVPGAGALGEGLNEFASAGRALNESRLIDRDAAWTLKLAALEAIWAGGVTDPRFDAYRQAGGQALETWARYATIAERHGAAWQAWPGALRRPESPAVAALAGAQADRVAFHAWMQWLLDVQLGDAAQEIGLVADVPIGVDPAGADAWAWQDLLASGVTIGAPPDRFNTRGQDWGLPPFIPHRLRAEGYRPFVETIRASLRHAAGLRMDHVMGLFRLWWIPEGAAPGAGAYVAYPARELLEIVALESERAHAIVIGEDLGTVEPGVRETLADHGVLSCKLLWFEASAPERWPAHALASVTTHDLPTSAGAWSGTDAQDQARIGLSVDPAEMAGLVSHLQAASGLPAGAPSEAVIVRAHRRLSGAPPVVVTATLEDALGVHERPNMPGTVDEWPNWRLALPVPLDELPQHPLARRVAEAMRQGRADGPQPADATSESATTNAS
jgi:4-alpha-glucanotransferase